MPVEDVPAKRWTCAGCGKSVLLEQNEKPEGYHGQIELVTRADETGGEVYACKKGCLLKAVIATTEANGEVGEHFPFATENASGLADSVDEIPAV